MNVVEIGKQGASEYNLETGYNRIRIYCVGCQNVLSDSLLYTEGVLSRVFDGTHMKTIDSHLFICEQCNLVTEISLRF